MKMVRLLALAGAATTCMTAPTTAATITYTYAGIFSGSNSDDSFATNAVFTGISDTDNATMPVLGLAAVWLTSFRAVILGVTYNISTPYVFGVNPVGGFGGFLRPDFREGFDFLSVSLIGYNGLTGIGPLTVSSNFTLASFQTDRGTLTLTDRSATGLFTADVATAVPEPAT